MWRRSFQGFSSKLLVSPPSSLHSGENGVVRSLLLSRSLSVPYNSSPSPSPSSLSLQESAKLGFQRSDGIPAVSTASIDFSSMAASKAWETADVARHYGCCYWELSKARLRETRTNNEFSTHPNMRSLAQTLQFCDTHRSISQGKQIHLLCLKRGLLECCVTIGNHLLRMYVKCGSMSDVYNLFEEMPQRNIFSWNTVIEGYMKSGDYAKSLELLKKMPERNEFSYSVVISGFAKLGLLDIARSLFDDMPRKSTVACTSIIRGYVRKGQQKDAFKLYKHLSLSSLEKSSRDKFVLATIVGVCTDLLAFSCGKQIHARILIDEVEVDSVLASSLVNFYGKCGDLDSASNMFNTMKEPDDYSISALIVSYASVDRMIDAVRVFNVRNDPSVELWSSMITGHVYNNDGFAALTLFNDMRDNGVKGDSLTLVSVLSACGILGVHIHSSQFHTHVCKVGMIEDIIVASALLDAYSKCGSLDDACKLFRELKSFDTILLNCMITVYSNCGRIKEAEEIFRTMPRRSLISWNSMISGLYQNGCSLEALSLFKEMNKLGLKFDQFNLASAVSACAGISSIEFGEQIFARAIVIGLECDEIISNSLLDFYCKCGFPTIGRKVFETMMKNDEVPWNSMMMGYATNGHGHEALSLFHAMLKANVTPNEITFVAVLSACDHCGFIEEGRRWFSSMKTDYHIDPKVEHYACVIDLLSRAGFLEEAMNILELMPFKADSSMLSSILRGCMDNGHKILGKKVVDKIVELDGKNSGAYVQLSSILASYGDWEGSEEVREVMRHKGLQKNPGFSWSEC